MKKPLNTQEDADGKFAKLLDLVHQKCQVNDTLSTDSQLDCEPAIQKRAEAVIPALELIEAVKRNRSAAFTKNQLSVSPIETLSNSNNESNAWYPKLAQSKFGRYTIQKLLGRGAYATVFLADDPKLKRPVALKIPRPQALSSQESKSRFEREAQMAAVLSHPSVVPIFEAGSDEGISYIAYQYCQGTTLDQWLRERKESVTPDLAARIVMRLADAVQHAHQRGILHRDLKPSNVMIDSSALEELPADDRSLEKWPAPTEIQITDFGLAKHVDEDMLNLTQSGSVVGTPCYMSPEQAAGSEQPVDETTDIYSLGVILYELLTEQVPHRESSFLKTIKAVESDEAIAPHKHRSGIPRDLEAICLKCLEKDQHQRYNDAASLSLDLNRFLAGENVLARPLTRLRRVGRWLRRNAMVASIGAIIFTLMLGGLITLFHFSNTTRESLEQTKQQYLLARNAVDEMVKTANSDSLYGQPVVKKELLNKALIYFQKFAQEEHDDQTLTADLARAHWQIGGITSAIGSKAEALESYEKAKSILEKMETEKPLSKKLELLRLNAELSAALMHSEMNAPQEAIRLNELTLDRVALLLAQDEQLATEIRHFHADLLLNYGYAKRQTGDFEAGIEIYKKAGSICKGLVEAAPEDAKYQYTLARSYFLICESQQNVRSQKADALASAKKALTFIQSVSAIEPENRKYRARLAATYNLVGDVFRNGPRKKDWSKQGLEYYDKAIVIQRELVSEFPDELSNYKGLANSLHNSAELYDVVGKYENGIQYLQESTDLLTKALERSGPNDVALFQSLANGYGITSQSYVRLQKFDLAVEQAQLSIDTFNRASAEGKPLSTRHQNLLARSLNIAAFANLVEGRFKKAESQFLQCVKILREPKQKRPHRLAECLHRLASIYTDDSSGMLNFKQAVTLAKESIELDPKGAERYRMLAFAQYRAQQYDQALLSIDRAIEMGDFGNRVYNTPGTERFIRALILRAMSGKDETKLAAAGNALSEARQWRSEQDELLDFHTRELDWLDEFSVTAFKEN